MSFPCASKNESFPSHFQHYFVSGLNDQKIQSIFLHNLRFSICYSFRSSQCDDNSLNKILRSEEMFKSIESLSSDLLYASNPGHCYTLITDPLYSEILQIKLFKGSIGRSSYFVVEVRFNEDMFSPKNATLATLRAAHRAGCRCYLIYLANGIQMNRFLQFIDRFVIKETRTNVFQSI